MYVRKKLFVLFRCCSTAFNSVVLTKLHFFKHCVVLLPLSLLPWQYWWCNYTRKNVDIVRTFFFILARFRHCE